ncbi:hypothetical protein LINGRAHAP2_LOCUS11976 [Linum grandiflorum]
MDSPSITQEQLQMFHSIDREVFSRMVINLLRDQGESMIVIAAWLWLEQVGYPNIIVLMACLSDAVIEILSHEMALALDSLKYSNAELATFMPATSTIMSKNITAEVFHRQRFTAIAGIKNFLNTVCARVFADILQPICRVANATGELGTAQLVIPHFPHPLFGGVNIVPPIYRPRYQQGRNGIDAFVPAGGAWRWRLTDNATEDDKTLFLTFSRGFPVTRDEVIELFNRRYGEGSVVEVMMQENVTPGGDQQPLFARVILRSVAMVDQVLAGDRIAKFRINGKHIWARKYERRDQMSVTTIPPSMM